MNTMKYEKPALEFVSLRNEAAVADTCWGYHGTPTQLFCDIEGEGYMSFQIGEGSCTLNLINVKYHEEQGSEGVLVFDGDPKHETLEDILVNSGGESGNPYKGMGTIVFPDKPDPTWS